MSQCACFSSKILSIVNLNRKLHACQKLGNNPGVGKCPAPGQSKFCKYPTPPGLTKRANATQQPGGGGGGRWVQLELTDALLQGKILLKSKFDIATHVETGFATHKHNYNKHQQWCIL